LVTATLPLYLDPGSLTLRLGKGLIKNAPGDTTLQNGSSSATGVRSVSAVR